MSKVQGEINLAGLFPHAVMYKNHILERQMISSESKISKFLAKVTEGGLNGG